MAWPVIGRAFSPAEFEAYVQGLTWSGTFHPLFIALHNTACPSLAQRPAGFTRQHILNLQAYYRDEKGWKGGPHLFIDDHQIWVFNDLTKFGTHSPSWNGTAIGIEMLGDYDCESFNEGRGRKVRDNTVAAMAILNKTLGFSADNFKFHIEDRKTDHACPGKLARAEREALIAEIEAAMAAGVPSPLVGEGEGGGERETPAVGVAPTPNPSPSEGGEATNPEPIKASVGFRERARVLQETIDMGSRLGTSIRSGLNTIYLLLFGAGAAGTAASTLLDPKKGNAQVATEALSPYPVLLIAIFALLLGIAITAGVAWWFFRRASNGLVTAVRTQRYVPPKQPTQTTAGG